MRSIVQDLGVPRQRANSVKKHDKGFAALVCDEDAEHSPNQIVSIERAVFVPYFQFKTRWGSIQVGKISKRDSE